MSDESKSFVGEISEIDHILHDLIPDPSQHYRVKAGIRIIVSQIRENMVPVRIMDGDTVVVSVSLPIAKAQARSDKPQIRDRSLLVDADVAAGVILDVIFRLSRDTMMKILTEIPQAEWQKQLDTAFSTLPLSDEELPSDLS